MRTEFLAGEEPLASRREFWQETAGRAIGAVELTAGGDIAPDDRIVAGSVGALRAGELIARYPGGAVRTAAHVRRAASDLYKIDIPVDGGGFVEQDGRQAVLRAGDFSLVDLSRPARWAMSPRRVIAVVFPGRVFPLRPDRLRRATAVTVPGDRGSGALASALAVQMVDRLDEYGPVEAARLGTAVLDLIGSALAGRLDLELPADARNNALLVRVLAFIDVNLADPRLSPAAVATANHVSLRSLHRLFESRDTTAGDWIRLRRLERAHADLRDPSLCDHPVAAIGARWGMPDPSHFSRAFRAAFGMPPAQFRAEFSRSGRPRPGRG